MYGCIISLHTPSCGRLWQTRAAASVNPRHAGHMDAFSPQSFADALECVVAATPVQIASCSSACCMNIVWEWKQHTIPGRLTLKLCLIWAIYGFLLLNDINRKSLWSQRVCGVHVGFFSSVCLRLKTSLASDFINQSCLGAILHMGSGQNSSIDVAMLMCSTRDLSTSAHPQCWGMAAFMRKARTVPAPSRWSVCVGKAGFPKVVKIPSQGLLWL